tara:strand:+ start:2962 stop:3993 length:1032 start_codon:yes stop_codon:yes gene_type:complete
MNVLIIGFGAAGKYYYQLLKKNKKVKKIFIYDVDKKIKIKIKKDFTELDKKKLFEKKITHAIISTPSFLHYKYSKILINLNLNLIIEKPMVLNINNAKKLIRLSKIHKKKCWVVFQNRCNLAIQKLKTEVSKRKNKIFYVDSKLLWHRDEKYYKSNWHGKYETDGGVLTNQAIHLIDSIIYLFGKIKKFQSLLRFNKKKLEAEDFGILNFIHKNNIVSSVVATTRANENYESSIDVIMENKRLTISGVSLNIFNRYQSHLKILEKKNSEIFSNKKGLYGAMGNGHKKILDEFLHEKCKKSSYDLEINKNLHILEVLHSIYNSYKIEKLKNIKFKQSILGKNEK